MKQLKLITLAVVVTSLIALATISLGKWINDCQRPISNWVSKCQRVLDKPLTHFSPLYAKVAWLSEYYSYLLGYDHPTTYLILLQNDTEMRANGGFFGSYAVMTLNSGQREIRFQDIYAPDGQLGSGHVEAPLPIEEAFRKGGFYLRDSDWESDFVLAAQTIRWFMEKGGEVNPDVMVTISLTTIKKIIEITGPIRIPDYDLELSSDNIFEALQAKVETDFFPGSTQKRDILSSVGGAFMSQLQSLPLAKKMAVAEILASEAQHKNILFNTTNLGLQTELERHNLAGALRYPKCSKGDQECNLDVYLAVEANLGANKANCCTQTQTTHTMLDQGETINHAIEVVYTNNSGEENPRLPDFFGGNYIEYVRFYVPKTVLNLRVVAEPTLPTTLAYYPVPYTTGPTRLDVNDYYLFKEIGMFHTTRAGTKSQIQISYDLPKTERDYELHILKQNGMHSSPQEIVFGETTAKTELTEDYVFSGVK